MAEPIPASLQAALTDLAKWLTTSRISATIIGGVAASALGRPRLTQDIDALAIVPEAEWNHVLESAERHGFVPRIVGALQFAERSRVLLLRHVDSGIDVDVIFGGLPFERAVVERSSDHDVGGLQVPLPRVEDLLILKAVAHRPKDIEDIRGLLAAHPEADVSEARHWVKEFAAAMCMSDILEDFDKLLARREP